MKAILPVAVLGLLVALSAPAGSADDRKPESVEDVADSDKLCQLKVNFGDHKRTIIAGIRKDRVNPREIEGKQALFVVNMEPRKMRGVMSEGMLFDIGYADGVTPVLAIPESAVPEGTRAG